MHEILPNLYVGSLDDAEEIVVRPDEARWTVINCTEELRNVSNRPSSHYKKIPLNDTGNLSDGVLFLLEIHPILDFIDKKLYANPPTPVLVHCRMGKSRSTSVVTAYILRSKVAGNVVEAKDYIIRKYPLAFDGGKLKVYNLALRHAFEHFPG
ncbi:hypothetical protein HDV00_002013 [Rhizophlyctis rosea]|nr:hypothetical protein HDV00_002013 [Rhizophlyctis rosea]